MKYLMMNVPRKFQILKVKKLSFFQDTKEANMRHGKESYKWQRT